MTGHCRRYTDAIVNELKPSLAVAPDVRQGTGVPPGRWVQVISDDIAQALPWSRALAAEGLRNHTRLWDAPASAAEPSAPPDAWIVHLSRGLPEQLARLRGLRAEAPDQPLVTVCTALRDLDHVLALEMGADDVLDASVPAPVVAARLRALWRRCAGGRAASSPQPDHLHFGALSLHWRERRVLLRQSPVPLTDGEFEVLWLLALRAGHAVSRPELVRQLRGLDYQRLDRSIDCRVYRIRIKLDDTEPSLQRIRTVRNRGYLFAPSPW